MLRDSRGRLSVVFVCLLVSLPAFATKLSSYPSATALLSSPNPSVYGGVVTLAASVTSTAGVPGGTITFKD